MASTSPAPGSRAQPVSVAIDPVALIVTECITVTSAMRKHARWAHSSVSAILGGSGPARIEMLKISPESRRMSTIGKEGLGAASQTQGDEGPLASRWGLRGKKGQSMQDNPLLAAFAKLRSDLKQCKAEAPAILHPFLQVIRSSSTSAPITSLALIAITKFFAYGIISRQSLHLPRAMQLLSSAVTHCRFEASDSVTDEIVLFRILKLMEGMITGPEGEVLGDESMCELMETGISMCCQVRLSELLRRSAEVSMVTMCQTIFQRLKFLEIEPEPEKIKGRTDSRSQEDAPKMQPSIDGDLVGHTVSSTEKGKEQGRKEDVGDSEKSSARPSIDKSSGFGFKLNGTSQVDLTTVPGSDEEIRPYALPSIRELFRVLVGLLDPHDRQHNDTMRVMALRIVDVALEVAGPSIADHPSLASLAKDTLCRHLFQLVRSENIVILNESLRVAGTLLSTCRRVLKLQQELFLSYLVACLHPRVEIPQEPGVDPALYEGVPQAPRLTRPTPSATSGRSTPVPIKDRQKLGMEGGTRKPDAREAMVESVGGLVRLPSFMAELFVNYDCEIDRADLCIDMVGLLSRNAFPDAATWSTTNVPPLCLDALLGFVHSIAERLGQPALQDGYPDLKRLRQQRAMKKTIIKGTSKFNENPKAGLAYLSSQGIIEDVENPNHVAKFLRGTSRVDKRVLGDFISKRGKDALLTAFLATFDFSDLRIDEALRQIVNAFRLPGEAPLIDRIVAEFTKQYFAGSNNPFIANEDALFVLTYATIMLNTDQHNPNVKPQARMKFADFSKNLRGVNDKQDFDQEFLQEIYDSIKTREIILAEEHDTRDSFDHAWKELLFKIQSTSDMTICDTNLFDQDMFAATWKPIIATMSYVFMSATDDTVFSRVVSGFDQCARIARAYGLHEALDHIIHCLSSISTMASASLPSTALNTDVMVGDKSVMVSETAVRFGRDFKAQLATVVLFKVVIGNESVIREGWTQLTRILLNLFVNSLLTDAYSTVLANADLANIPLQSPASVIDREKTNETGIFSAFTSYVSSFANDEPPEPSDQEIEYTLCTVDCIKACGLEVFFQNISQLPIEAMQPLVEALLQYLPEDNAPSVIVVKSEAPSPKSSRPNGTKAKTVGVAYEPSVVFVLELCTILAARDSGTMKHLGGRVSEALQASVRVAGRTHPVTLARVVYCLLSFLRASHEFDFVRAPVLLHTISKFDPDTLKQCGVFVLKGLLLCLTGPSALLREVVTSPDFWSILQTLHSGPETAPQVFDILQALLDEEGSALTAGNFDAILSLLNSFATAGSIGALEEQRNDQPSSRSRPGVKEPGLADAVDRGVKSILLVYQLSSRVHILVQQSQLDAKAGASISISGLMTAWTTYWPPVFRTLTTHSLNPCRKIRQPSLSCLQRVLLSDSITLNPTAKLLDASRAISLFTEVIFPLIGQLLNPEIIQTDPTHMGDTRLQAAVMCCKVFVRYLDIMFNADTSKLASLAFSPMSPPGNMQETASFPLPEQNVSEDAQSEQTSSSQDSPDQGARALAGNATTIDGIRLWSHVLQVLERLIKSEDHSEGMEEAIPESLKNIVLVMASDGYLVPPASQEERTAQQKRLWKVTYVRLERFQPGLMEGIFPGAGRETPRAQSSTPQPLGEVSPPSEARPSKDIRAMSAETVDESTVPAPTEAAEERDSKRRSSEETVIVETQT